MLLVPRELVVWPHSSLNPQRASDQISKAAMKRGLYEGRISPAISAATAELMAAVAASVFKPSV